MIKKYRTLLKAQYTPTKLFNYLTQYETHENAAILYGDIHSVKSIALIKNVKLNVLYHLPSSYHTLLTFIMMKTTLYSTQK